MLQRDGSNDEKQRTFQRSNKENYPSQKEKTSQTNTLVILSSKTYVFKDKLTKH